MSGKPNTLNQGPAQQGQYQSTTLITSSKDDTPSSDLKLKVSQAGIDLFREKVIPEGKGLPGLHDSRSRVQHGHQRQAEGWHHPR